MAQIEVHGPRATRKLAVLSCVLFALFSGIARAQNSDIGARYESFAFDSGPLDNPSDVPEVLFEIVVDAGPEASWARLVFDDVQLQPGSFVRMTALSDADMQTLDAQEMVQWGLGSAFFNGNNVLVELIGGARTRDNSISMSRVMAGLRAVFSSQQPTVCGDDDDRIPAAHNAVARLLTGTLGDGSSLGGGCTGFIINTPPGPDKCHLSAGHCFVPGAGPHQVSSVVQFNVPASNADCSISHPPAAKQFAIRANVSNNGGVGDDWSVFTCFRNPDTNRTTFEEQGLAIGLGVPAVPSMVAVVGHGVDGNRGGMGGGNDACSCIPGIMEGQRHQTLQVDSGPLLFAIGTTVDYDVDTCGGNSGSPVLDEVGLAIGIHTHGSCSIGGPNRGTSVTHLGLETAIADCKASLGTTVPTMSEWAMLSMTLLLAAAGAIVLIRRSHRASPEAPTI